MTTDCTLTKSNPFQDYQGETIPAEVEAAGGAIYSVSITVTNGTFSDNLTLTFTTLTNKPAGTFKGILIPSSLTAGTYPGNAIFAGTVASYADQQIIALAAQVGGVNTINFATPNAIIGSVTSSKLDVSCSGGLFQATAPS